MFTLFVGDNFSMKSFSMRKIKHGFFWGAALIWGLGAPFLMGKISFRGAEVIGFYLNIFAYALLCIAVIHELYDVLTQ